MKLDCLLIVLIIILLYTGKSSFISKFTADKDSKFVIQPNDWNQYIRDEAQRVVYLKNNIYRGGYCFPEVVGWTVEDATKHIKEANPELYIDLNDERVPARKDIYYSQPNRVILTFDSRGYVSRIPLSG